MKKTILSIFTVLFIFSTMFTANAADLTGKLGVSANAGLIMPMNGAIDSHDDTKDIFNAGPGFGLALTYGITPDFVIEGNFSYNWMKQDDKAANGDEPSLVIPAFEINGLYHFGNLINPAGKFSPFAKAGIGIYPWKVTEDGISGDALSIGSDDFSKTSFGMNFGAGCEYFIADQYSIKPSVSYLFLFSEDEDTFGKDFENQGFLKFNLGINYYFSL